MVVTYSSNTGYLSVGSYITAINYTANTFTANFTAPGANSISIQFTTGLAFMNNGIPVVADSSYTDINTYTWYHIAYVRSNTTGILFVNGNIVGTGVDNNTYGTVGTTGYIGKAYNNTNYFAGYMSNIRFNTTAVYTTAFTPSTVPLGAITGTTLLICQNLSFIDNSNAQNTITPVGFAKTSLYTPFTTLVQSGPVSKIAAGGSHSVAILASNMLMAWGHNNYGQLGDNTTTLRSVASQIGANSWSQVAAGISSTAAIRSDGKLFTWGSNVVGELGDTTTISRSSPVQIGSLNWSTIIMSTKGDNAGAYTTTGGIRTDGTLWTWGYNAYGQMGNNNAISTSSPVLVGNSAWTQIAFYAGTYVGGDYAMYGINATGYLYAWGNNSYNQLGDNTTGNPSRSSPIQIGTSYASLVETPTVLDTNSWSQISAGASHNMAIRNNTLYAWGYNNYGQLGLNTAATESNIAQIQANGSSFVSVAAGADYTFGITNLGYIIGFGYNANGQLATNDTQNRSNPVQLTAIQGNTLLNYSSPVQIGLSSWIFISAGWSHSAAIRSDGTLWTWGTNENYNLGDATLVTRSSPVQLGASTFTQVGSAYSWNVVSAGRYHTVAIRSDRTLWGWGSNSWGQLGAYNTTTATSPIQIGQTAYYGLYYGPNYFQDVKAGVSHTVALGDNNLVWAWGDNSQGELGASTIWSTSSPVQISTTPYKVISAGYYTSGGIDYYGSLYAWGLNTVGQAGNNNVNYSWKQLSNGDQHSMALRNDGAMFTWGSNSWGQLGTNRYTVNFSSPIQIGTSSWSFISAGNSHSAAIRSDGALFVWGGNSWGQIGTGFTTLGIFSPTQIGLSSWIAVAAGGNHTLAVRSDNTLWA